MMTIEQHREYVDDLHRMLCKIVRVHGLDSPQSNAMSSIHFKELMAYLDRLSIQCESAYRAELGG